MVGREEGKVEIDVGFAGGGGQLVYPIIMDFALLFVLVCPPVSPPYSLEIPLTLEICKT